MSDMIKREDVLRIIEARFSKTMIGDILKQDILKLPEAEIRTGGRQCRIDRCELFNRLATITAEDANEMKAKIYAVIQEMPAIPERMLQPIHVQIDKEKTEEILEKIREEYELTDDIVRCRDCIHSPWYYDDDGPIDYTCIWNDDFADREQTPDDFCSYGKRRER